ncbi:hypothetical protein BATDEDRAFT_21556 [Batrachochytrium dendrobatidis JAM81]|uniref:non-specific serine/threonine protein kinase n=1 Tax=Batrachochytrium dendrobatidis (strain JAM81 / FGSC 10211) TaxID=684364 RepID=F4NTT0_BATDJ|nr:uncharacterized protein BATDEDRAFT_21556 [Batrachochytrium dendrobatidis JAM81]EGF83132.1 hypothetical protein BATDEDRAFT_21556 [Batrachochytrium dendrobatidis JAM81]|eukprot:XP_006675319.1 hypothetical protein BATDEDRAFT_21556 [Batrachochytrium dendrobatidis JAM81]
MQHQPTLDTAITATSTNAASSTDSSSSMRIGDFSFGSEVGRGSFATVYKAVHLPTSTTVAIKSVSRAKLNRKLAENLETEIRILQGIHHPNIVQLLDILKTDTDIHLVMEYCSLGDLSIFIKKKGMVGSLSGSSRVSTAHFNGPWGGLHETVIRHFLAQLVASLEFMRSKSLIHRDLKPQNLLLCPASLGQPDVRLKPIRPNIPAVTVPALPTLKLADFGFARALPAQSMASTLCGSPLYMAPEILRGDKYDAKADLWSLGGILYEMITGRPPFNAQNHIELLRKIESRGGWIKFPGEAPDERNVMRPREVPGQLRLQPLNLQQTQRRQPSAHQSQFTQQQPGHRVSLTQLAASPINPSTPLHVGSLGSSPKYANFTKARDFPPVPDDLKDLVRRLLKRDPVERMTFEELFMHPCVAVLRVAEPRISTIPLRNTTTGFNPAAFPSGSSDNLSQISSLAIGIKRLPSRSSQLHLQSHPSQSQMQHYSPPTALQQLPCSLPSHMENASADIRFVQKQGLRKSPSFQAYNTHSPVSPSPLNPMSNPSREDISYNYVAHRTSADNITTHFGAGGGDIRHGAGIEASAKSEVKTTASAPSDISYISKATTSVRKLEPPFAEYGLQMLPHDTTRTESRTRFPPALERQISAVVGKPTTPHTLLHITTALQNRPEYQLVPLLPPTHPSIVPVGTFPPPQPSSKSSIVHSQSSFGSSVGSFIFSDDDSDEKQTIPALSRHNTTPGRIMTQFQTKAQEKSIATAKDMPKTTGQASSILNIRSGSMSLAASTHITSELDDHKTPTSESMQESEEYVVVEKGVVEVNWLADQVASQAQLNKDAAMSDRLRKSSSLTDLSGRNNGPQARLPFGTAKSFTPPRRTDSIVPTASDFVHNRPYSALSLRSASVSGIISPIATNTAPVSMCDVRMKRTSSDASKPRVLGSLRSLNPSQELPAQTSFSDAHHSQNDAKYSSLPYMTDLDTSALDEPQASFFSTLNLCALRAHAVNTLADGYFVELEKFTTAKSLTQTGSTPTLPSHQVQVQESIVPSTLVDMRPFGRAAGQFNVATLADETLTLYLHCLAQYQYAMELARKMWDQERERLTPTQSMLISRFGFGIPKPTATPGENNMLANLSVVVQWIRDRFNDCLSKADISRSRVGKHDNVGKQQGFVASITGDGITNTALPTRSSFTTTTLAPNIAEKLIYDYAMHTSHQAAVQELHQTGMGRCEMLYQQAILLLESLLHVPPRPLSPLPGVLAHTDTDGHDGHGSQNGEEELTDNDRIMIEKFLLGLYSRLDSLRT